MAVKTSIASKISVVTISPPPAPSREHFDRLENEMIVVIFIFFYFSGIQAPIAILSLCLLHSQMDKIS